MPARSFSYVDEDAYFFRLISTPPRPSETSRPFDAEARYTCTPFWFFISKRERPPATGRLDRLALLGEMTASMAHEVNQPISGIIINAGTALRFTAARGPVPPHPFLGEPDGAGSSRNVSRLLERSIWLCSLRSFANFAVREQDPWVRD